MGKLFLGILFRSTLNRADTNVGGRISVSSADLKNEDNSFSIDRRKLHKFGLRGKTEIYWLLSS